MTTLLEKTRPSLRPLALALILLGCAGPALAREPGGQPDGAGVTVSRSSEGDRTEAKRPNLSERLRERLAHIPLRPVRIGSTPRLPDDPEPGMGLVVRIPF